MPEQDFSLFANPSCFIAVAANESPALKSLCANFPALITYYWLETRSASQNFDSLVERALECDRTKLLIAECSAENCCLTASLLALGRGFDVYLCGDLIDEPEDEKSLLIGRLRQHGAVIVSKKQILIEFSATLQATA